MNTLRISTVQLGTRFNALAGMGLRDCRQRRLSGSYNHDYGQFRRSF